MINRLEEETKKPGILINKLHGFAYMSDYTNKGIAPCVKAKPYECGETSIDYDVLYSIKEVRETPEKCLECYNTSCELCENFYYDFALPCLKKVHQEDIDNWISQRKALINKNSIFYYYKYFFADIYGRLIINKSGIIIEILNAYDSDDSDKIAETIVEDSFNAYENKSNILSLDQLNDLRIYSIELAKKNMLLLQCNSSIIFNFAFTTENYFKDDIKYNELYKNTNLLFYGMRSYPYVREINFSGRPILL